MTHRRGFTRLTLVIAGLVALEACGAVAPAIKLDDSPAARAKTNPCAQQESAARSAALDASHAANKPATSPQTAMAASLAQSRAAIAESEYRNCLVSH